MACIVIFTTIVTFTTLCSSLLALLPPSKKLASRLSNADGQSHLQLTSPRQACTLAWSPLVGPMTPRTTQPCTMRHKKMYKVTLCTAVLPKLKGVSQFHSLPASRAQSESRTLNGRKPWLGQFLQLFFSPAAYNFMFSSPVLCAHRSQPSLIVLVCCHAKEKQHHIVEGAVCCAIV